MSAPTPRENPHLFGHAAAESAFANALQDNRMHHAWLITGPAGIGKATLAYRMARTLFAGAAPASANDPRSPLFRRVAENSHADLLSIEREWDEKKKQRRTEIVVDTVRAVPTFLHLTPAEGGWRVVIVDEAEMLNRNAANALLKVLEEPPARAVLMLVCAAPGRLPPTIRSRCRLLRLSPLPPDAMARALEIAAPDADAAERERLALLGEGSPGRAAAMAGQGVATAELVATLLQAPNLTLGRILDTADGLARTEEAYSGFMDRLRDGIADAVRAQAAGRPDAAQAALAGRRPLAAWVDLWHTLGQMQDETERFHLERRHAIVSALELLNGP